MLRRCLQVAPFVSQRKAWNPTWCHSSSSLRLPFSTTTTPADNNNSTSPVSENETTANSVKPPRRRLDPLAKRPNQKCDPYGQGGKPMDWAQAQGLLATVHEDWKLQAAAESDGDNKTITPTDLVREFVVADFSQAARLVSALAAVSVLQNHFPSMTLDRRIVRKEWQTLVRVQCHTTVLGGLSMNDFHLAMMIDVEVERPNIKQLLVAS